MNAELTVRKQQGDEIDTRPACACGRASSLLQKHEVGVTQAICERVFGLELGEVGAAVEERRMGDMVVDWWAVEVY